MILSQKKKRITQPCQVANVLYEILKAESDIDQSKEHFWAIGLNGSNVIQYIELTALGILNKCVCHPREIFRLAITKAVNSIIIAHNHPSGNLTPSAEDIRFTNTIRESGEILGIELIDHIIIGNLENEGEYYSSQEEQVKE